MDLEECVQVSKQSRRQILPLWLYVQLSAFTTFVGFRQITDGTLIQLSIHCPRLQVLVSVYLQLEHILLL